MYWSLSFVLLVLLSSCGGVTPFADRFGSQDREIASTALQRLMQEEEQTLTSEIDEKLQSLHSYYMIAFKYLHEFDQSIHERTLKEIYESKHYQGLLAIKTQIDEIEKELLSLYEEGKASHKKILKNRVAIFGGQRVATNLSLQNLSFAIGISQEKETYLSRSELEKEYAFMSEEKEFQIYEKNIDHLSHLMGLSMKSHSKKFSPSEEEMGSISGQEFPPHVWALTFSNGPGLVTDDILQELKKHGITATFFQLAAKTLNDTSQSKNLLKSGMEIGTESYSNKELAKAGSMTLEKEITDASVEMEKALKIDIQFFRLPYASGAHVPSVRQLIAKNNLIHVLWNVDTLDWMAQEPGRIVERTRLLMKKTRHESGIILFHDVHPRSVKASSEIMKDLKLSHRKTCRLETIVKDMNKDLEAVCSQNSF